MLNGTRMINVAELKSISEFEKVDAQAKAFAVNYCGNTIIRNSVFSIASNYARKRELSMEILRYPFKDEELWAFTLLM